MLVGFEVTGARSKKPDPDAAVTKERMRGSVSPAARRRPDSDELKIRRRNRRTNPEIISTREARPRQLHRTGKLARVDGYYTVDPHGAPLGGPYTTPSEAEAHIPDDVAAGIEWLDDEASPMSKLDAFDEPLGYLPGEPARSPFYPELSPTASLDKSKIAASLKCYFCGKKGSEVRHDNRLYVPACPSCAAREREKWGKLAKDSEDEYAFETAEDAQ